MLAATRVDLEGSVSSVSVSSETSSKEEALRHSEAIKDFSLGFAERAFSTAGTTIVSAVIVNPLDVAKTRLQAQATGVPYEGLCHTASFESNMACELPFLGFFTLHCTLSEMVSYEERKCLKR
ncbi:mitochondrial carrier protein MTM1-like [Citrus clementina]|uniref:mitochondrial carrier protein MTM1-like n=1 Tax=Citrus clementina TaxID=85681 RepID=UPI000CED5CFA|nr:mitochondrial carrier protein MTM1-like [Citrus x clementina]